VNYYLLLKISENAGQQEIELAFADFKATHQKYCPGVEINEQDMKMQFPEICKAFDTLINPISRREYDLQLKNQEYKILSEILEEPEVSELNLKQKVFKLVYFTGLIVLLLFLIYSMSAFFKL
jgi:DnaJ-class molecular chaperone